MGLRRIDLDTVRVAKSFPEWGHGLQSDVCARSYGVFREPLQTARHSIPRHDLCRGHVILSPFRFGSSCEADIKGKEKKIAWIVKKWVQHEDFPDLDTVRVAAANGPPFHPAGPAA